MAQQAPQRKTIRVDLPADVLEALERRARRNDRYPFEEARSILRRSLAREPSSADEAEQP